MPTLREELTLAEQRFLQTPINNGVNALAEVNREDYAAAAEGSTNLLEIANRLGYRVRALIFEADETITIENHADMFVVQNPGGRLNINDVKDSSLRLQHSRLIDGTRDIGLVSPEHTLLVLIRETRHDLTDDDEERDL